MLDPPCCRCQDMTPCTPPAPDRGASGPGRPSLSCTDLVLAPSSHNVTSVPDPITHQSTSLSVLLSLCSLLFHPPALFAGPPASMNPAASAHHPWYYHFFVLILCFLRTSVNPRSQAGNPRQTATPAIDTPTALRQSRFIGTERKAPRVYRPSLSYVCQFFSDDCICCRTMFTWLFWKAPLAAFGAAAASSLWHSANVQSADRQPPLLRIHDQLPYAQIGCPPAQRPASRHWNGQCEGPRLVP